MIVVLLANDMSLSDQAPENVNLRCSFPKYELKSLAIHNDSLLPYLKVQMRGQERGQKNNEWVPWYRFVDEAPEEAKQILCLYFHLLTRMLKIPRIGV